MKHISPRGMLIVDVLNADDAQLSLYQCNVFAGFTYWKCYIYLYAMDALRLLAKKEGLQAKFMRKVQRYPLRIICIGCHRGSPAGILSRVL